MPPPITFYEINEESLGLALLEARAKVVNASAKMCGILIEDIEATSKNRPEWEMLLNYRNKKEFANMIEENKSK